MPEAAPPTAFTLPKFGDLEKLRTGIDQMIDAATAILDTAAEVGGFVDHFPFLPADLHTELDKILSAAAALDRDLKLAKAFLDHVPL